MNNFLFELEASEQAKQLGLVYLGYGGWGYPDDPERNVVARTIDGKLVKKEDEKEAESKKDLGQLSILTFEDALLRIDSRLPEKYAENFKLMIKAIINSGTDFVVLCKRGSERLVADYLRKNGVRAGVKIVPLDNITPALIHDYVKKKINEGFTTIEYFDVDDQNCNAVESLKATFNKIEELTIDVHPLVALDSGSNPESLVKTIPHGKRFMSARYA